MTPSDRLQQLAPQYLWAVADSLLLQSIAQGKPVQRGLAGMRLNRLVQLFAKARLAYALLFIVGLAELAKLLLQQRRKTDRPSPAGSGQAFPAFIFVGFGAGPEESLFANYCAEKGQPVARIDQTKVETMGHSCKVGVIQGVASLLHSRRLARQAMANLPKEFLPWREDFITFVGMRLGYFSFVSAWFGQLKKRTPGVTEVCFLAPDMAAFAAVNVGLPTRYLQHGLNRHSLLLPHFTRVDALTHDEVAHFRRRLPNAEIVLARPVLSKIAPRRPPCLLVASVYGDHDEMRRIVPLLEFAAEKGVAIHVRPHPREDRSFWLTSKFPFEIALEDGDPTFDAALERIQPTIVASWFSTALVDALYRGVIPISVCDRDDLNIQDMIYPLFRHCLHWPSDQAVLERVVSDEGAYSAALANLGAGMEHVQA